MGKKIAVCGHFGKGHILLNGQTVKTIIIANELESEFGVGNLWRIDTHGHLNKILMFPKLIIAIMICDSLIILPAHNALRYEVPWISFWNRFFHRKLLYVVIGGWLKDYLENYPKITNCLKHFDGIFVETSMMKKNLENVGFRNIFILPNCKPLKILHKDELANSFTEPLSLVTFSRVMKEKGIEIAIDAVKNANQSLERKAYRLVVYGQIDKEQKEWFEGLLRRRDEDSSWEYGGLVPFDSSTEVLKNHFALLFPTFYEGEGFAGTLIDAFASGVPVIASDWKYNSEIVKNNKNGLLVEAQSINSLKDALVWAFEHQYEWSVMKENCLQDAEKYTPSIAIKPLIRILE